MSEEVVGLLLAALIVLDVSLWMIKRRIDRKRMLEPAEDAALAVQVQQLCALLGHPSLPVAIVTGGGKPYVGRFKGKLFVSKGLSELLTDDELMAAARSSLAMPEGYVQRAYRRRLIPLLVLYLLFALFFSNHFWLFMFVSVAVLAASHLASSLWVIVGIGALRESITAFLRQGGDPFALISALLKMGAAGAMKAGAKYQFRRRIKTTAEVAGITPEALKAIGEELGVPADLYG